jgi:hypothetical protein
MSDSWNPFEKIPEASSGRVRDADESIPDTAETARQIGENAQAKPKRKPAPDHTQRVINHLEEKYGGIWWRVDGWARAGMMWKRKDMLGLFDVMGFPTSCQPVMVQIIDPTGRGKHLRKMVDDVDVVNGRTRRAWMLALLEAKVDLMLVTVAKDKNRWVCTHEFIERELVESAVNTPKHGRIKA